MSYRLVCEVTGYVPPDSGEILCPDCHSEQFPDHDPMGCECGAQFLGDETDYVVTCGTCGEECETTVIGENA